MLFLFETHLIITGTTPEINFSWALEGSWAPQSCKVLLHGTRRAIWWHFTFWSWCNFYLRPISSSEWRQLLVFCTHVCASRPVQNIKRPFSTRLHICRFLQHFIAASLNVNSKEIPVHYCCAHMSSPSSSPSPAPSPSPSSWSASSDDILF